MPKFDALNGIVPDGYYIKSLSAYDLNGNNIGSEKCLAAADTDECYIEEYTFTGYWPSKVNKDENGKHILKRIYMDFDIKDMRTGKMLFEARLNKVNK